MANLHYINKEVKWTLFNRKIGSMISEDKKM